MSETTTDHNIQYQLLPGAVVTIIQLLTPAADACWYVWNAIFGQQNQLYEDVKANEESPCYSSFFTVDKAFATLRSGASLLPDYSYKIIHYTLKLMRGNINVTVVYIPIV